MGSEWQKSYLSLSFSQSKALFFPRVSLFLCSGYMRSAPRAPGREAVEGQCPQCPAVPSPLLQTVISFLWPGLCVLLSWRHGCGEEIENYGARRWFSFLDAQCWFVKSQACCTGWFQKRNGRWIVLLGVQKMGLAGLWRRIGNWRPKKAPDFIPTHIFPPEDGVLWGWKVGWHKSWAPGRPGLTWYLRSPLPLG